MCRIKMKCMQPLIKRESRNRFENPCSDEKSQSKSLKNAMRIIITQSIQ